MRWLRGFLMAFFGIIVIVMILTKPLNRISLSEKAIYKQTLDSVRLARTYSWSDSLPFRVSFGKVNITPSYSMPMAGYAQRDAFENVHDSLYCRLMLIEKGGLDLYLVSADLLIFPDKLRDSLMAQTKQDENTRIYISATHTHNGLGGWADGPGGNLIAGTFHPEWLSEVSKDLKDEMKQMKSRTKQSSLLYFESDASEYVMNRLVHNAPVDGWIRGLKIIRDSGDSALLFTYSGHPTLIERKSRDLSNDYPGATMKKLESEGFTFSMFMAGMVGSHRITNVQGSGYERIDALSGILTQKILTSDFQPLDKNYIRETSFEIPFGPSQVRIMSNLVVRDWLFASMLQPLDGNIMALDIGGINFVNTPCDFSGELYSSVHDPFKPVIITSFNGDYIGYITNDEHYDHSDYMEVRTMNWVGPYYGDLFCTMINGALSKLDSLN